MTAKVLSLILLPTLDCNADCAYCFEERGGERLSLDRLRVLIERVLDHLVEQDIDELLIHWQGGEAMTLPPSWYLAAQALIDEAAASRGRSVSHGLQSNLIAYGPAWNVVIERMFGQRVGTSMDFPNRHRRLPGGTPEAYTERWTRKVREARAAGIEVSVIAVAHAETLALGAERCYDYFVTELGIDSFQINTPFAGHADAGRHPAPLDPVALTEFLVALADRWLEQGLDQGVRIGPFDALLQYFQGEPATLPCLWTQDCSRHLLAIDARGEVAQCDCWVTSHPDYRYGNLLTQPRLGDLLDRSPVRARFQARPMHLVRGDCIDCDWLALCHGGCPIRAYSQHGELFARDPYCEVYRAVFSHMDRAAARLAGTA